MTSRFLPSTAVDAVLQLIRPRAHELAAQHVDQGAADDHAEHAAELDFEAVGGARAAAPEVLQLPCAVDGLQLALLLAPVHARRPVVAEADDRLDGADLGVGGALGERDAALDVALDLLHVLEPALPVGCAPDVLDDRPHLVDGRLDLRCRGSADLRHSSLLSLVPSRAYGRAVIRACGIAARAVRRLPAVAAAGGG